MKCSKENNTLVVYSVAAPALDGGASVWLELEHRAAEQVPVSKQAGRQSGGLSYQRGTSVQF